MPNPTEMIRTDHQRLREQFQQYEHLPPEATEERKAVVNRLLTDLEAHARVEEQILYPRAREIGGDDFLVDLAEEEHHGAKVFVMELAMMDPTDSHYTAKFQVLREMVEHHMEEEESDMLPRIDQADPNRLETIGAEMERRWPEFREEAAKMVDGGLVENMKGAWEQLKAARGASPGS